MAKTESTAVNELIDLVQNNKQPAQPEPGAELFAAPAPSTRIQPARMTSPVPALRSAGEVEPLPRGRAPHSTSQLRMSTADPERGNTIPPLSQPMPPPTPRSATAVPPPRKTPRSTGAVPTLPTQRAATAVPPQRPSQVPTNPTQRAATAPPIPTRRASSPSPHAQRTSSPPPNPAQRASSAPPIPRQRPASVPPPPAAPRASAPPFPARIATQMPAQRPPSAPLPAQADVAALALRNEMSPLPLRDEVAPAPVDLDMTPLPPPFELSPLPGPLPSLPLSSALSAPTPHSLPVAVPIQQRATVPSLPSLPPPTSPVAAPFDAHATLPHQYPVISRPRTIDATGDVVRAEQWFELSAPVPKAMRAERSEGTAVVARQHSDTLALIKKLIAPTIILAIIGVMVGGYFAFDGQGGKTRKPQAAAAAAAQESTRIAMPVVPAAAAMPVVPAAAPTPAPAPAAAVPAPAPEAAAAVPAPAPEAAAAAPSDVAQPEPPTKSEDLAKAEAARAPDVAAPAPAIAAPAPAIAAPAPAIAAPAPAIAAPATVREVRTTRGVVKLVDVRIDSKPAGATVMLVDNGKTSFLGTTPLATSLDPSRKYDVIFTLTGRPTQMAPLDPTTSTRLEVTLARGKSERSANKPSAPAAAKLGSDFLEEPAAKAAKKTATEAKAETTEAVAPNTDKKAAAGGEGTLMVSSKPPCEIIIDGKPTGLTTPQRSITLPAGVHKVTFVNAAEGIKKTVSVTITADQPTKLIQDLMNK